MARWLSSLRVVRAFYELMCASWPRHQHRGAIFPEASAPEVLFFRLLHQFCGTRCKVSIETCKARRTRLLSRSGTCKSLIRSVVLELWHDLPTLIAVAGDLDFSEDNTAHSCLPSSL